MPLAQPPEGFIIRPGRPGDARAFRDLDRLCFAPTVAFPLDVFFHHLTDPDSINIVAEAPVGDGDVELAAFIVAEVFRGRGQIVTMDVSENYRRRGLGTWLIAACEDGMTAKGASKSALQVAVDNMSAISLYEKAGYRPLGRIPGYYPHPPPRGTDAIYMVKELSAFT